MCENDVLIREEGPSTCPLVCVVIPTRGRADLLAQCVASVLAQTVTDLEVIVVVDGPDPATIDFLSNVDDERVGYVVHPESRGVSNARNTGIARAGARWIAFCDDDDVWAPTKLAAQLAALDGAPDALWAIAGAVRASEDRGTATYPEPPTSEFIASALPHTNPVPGGCSGVVADRRLVLELGGFDLRLSTLADMDLWMRLNWSSPVAVAAEPLVGYRDHARAMTRRLRKLEDELDVMRDKYREQLRASAREFPSETLYVWAYRRTFRSGDWRGGLRLFVRSPRFRSAVTQWVWTQGRNRLREAAGAAGSVQPGGRAITVSEFPWLAPIIGPAWHGRKDEGGRLDLERRDGAVIDATPTSL